MLEALPKIADVKILKELSKILIIPMLIAAFIVQTGLSIDFGSRHLAITPESSFFGQALAFLAIFLLKGVFVGGWRYVFTLYFSTCIYFLNSLP